MSQPDDRMFSRLAPQHPRGGSSQVTTAPQAPRPGFLIEITAADGAMLLRLREDRGRLVIEGDESRWPEATKRFLYQMMQWSGQAGLRWKDDVKAAAGS